MTHQTKWRSLDSAICVGIALGLAVYYAAIIPTEITFGDGPELLVAAHNFGVPHPSGYPLFSVLGAAISRLPGFTPFFHVAFWLSAVPTALAGVAIFAAARTLGTGPLWALGAALVWGLSSDVVYQGTRIEIYGLHCLFVALSLWAVTRFARDKNPRWAVASVLFVCLGLTNHLTTAFLIIPMMVGLSLIAPKVVWAPRTVLAMGGVAAACSAVYLYLPLAAMMSDGSAIVWNDPQSWDGFVFHVTGAEYSIFRSDQGVWRPLSRFGRAVSGRFFPGALVLVGFGMVVWGRRQWRTLVVGLGYGLCLLGYISTFNINDIATYYTSLYVLVALGLALGVHGALALLSRWRKPYKAAATLVFVAALYLLGYLGVTNWDIQYRERLAEDMSGDVMASLRDPAIVFTNVDGHTFPMWYQTFMVAPERKVVVIDRVLFHLENKQWYRDFMRRTYPDVVWPDDKAAKGAGWEAEIVRDNPRHHIAALLDKPWQVAGTHSVPRGWHHDIVPGSRRGRAPTTMHIYTAYGAKDGLSTRFYHSSRAYAARADRIACVVEWHRHRKLRVTWNFYGPSGDEIRIGPRTVPPGTGSSWEYLELDRQAVGSWRCEVTRDGQPPLTTQFSVTAPDD
jgi:hypothetical protein